VSEYANTDRREPIRLSSIIDAVNNVILLACALMKTAAKGDTTHELQNTANGTDVECKLLRRGF